MRDTGDLGRTSPAPGPVRVGRGALVLAFALGLIVTVAAVAIASRAATPRPPSGCPPLDPCFRPPPLSRVVERPAGLAWEASSFGDVVDWDPGHWTVAAQDERNLRLTYVGAAGGDGELWLRVVPAAESTDQALLDERLADLSATTVGLEPDPSPAHAVLGPSIGYVDGVGGAYQGHLAPPGGAVVPLAILVMAASDGGLTAVVSVVTSEPDGMKKYSVLAFADDALNTFRWPSRS